MLGRPYSVYGQISHGQGQGGPTLQCPTANLADPNIILPPRGVYAARAYVCPQRSPLTLSEEFRNGITYVGTAPTIRTTEELQTAKPIVELHIFDFHESLYGQPVEIEFHDFIRGEQQFESKDELQVQIRDDIRTASQHLNSSTDEK